MINCVKSLLEVYKDSTSMFLLSSFRILLGILLGPSLLSSRKQNIILSTLLLSVGVIKEFAIDRSEIIKVFLLGESDHGGLNIYVNFSITSKEFAMSEELVTFCFFSYSSENSMIRSV